MAEERAELLARKLERLAEASIDKLSDLLALPIDVENGAVVRAMVGAANTALNAQLRADAMRLRALRDDKALATLLALIAAKEGTVPACPPVSGAGRVVDAASVSADTVPYLA